MGKGKRNRQLHVEDTTGAPQKQETKNVKSKKKFVWPVWAKRALCIALLVAVLAGIIVAAVISSGAILRGRIIVESKSGKFDMNQQMATFILWQTMYQQASYEWQNAYYQQYFGGSKSEILTQYQSPEQYGITMAAYYTKEVLNSGLNTIKDYLIEIVAGADAALEAGLKFEAHDKEDVKGVVTWMQNIYVNLGFNMSGIPFKNFLAEYVGDSFRTSDIEKAAKVMIMYSKYNDYMNFQLQDDPDEKDLQDYILKNPAGFFETKYYSYTGATIEMIRDLFSDKFMEERFESTVAKHFANQDRLAITDLKDAALTAKLEELGLNNAVKYTRTENEDGDFEYDPKLADDAIGDYIFGTSNKAGTFAAISGDKCAYLVYYKETSTATTATVAIKEYKYEDYKDNLSEITDVDKLIAECIKAGENTTEFKTDNDKASDLLGKMEDEEEIDIPDDQITTVDTTKPLEKDDTNTAPKSILDALYGKNASVYMGWKFIVNDPNESYVVKVVDIKKDDAGKNTTNYTISYVKFTDDLFASVLNTFEAEFNLYLLETKVDAPTYSMTFATFEEKVVNWLMDENFKELVLTKKANNDYDELLLKKADSNKEVLASKLTELFGEDGVKTYTKSNKLKKEFETMFDSKVYDYIFNSKNKDSASVIVGKDDRVFLVYVAPVTEDEPGHEGHDHSNTVHAAIKEYKLEDYKKELEQTITKDDKEETKTFQELIIKDLLADRKDTTSYKSAEDKAKEALDALKSTTNPAEWKEFETVTTKKPLEKNDTNTAPEAIIDKIYPNGSKATKVDLTVNTYYQVDDNGTSYVIKLTEIDAATLACKVEYRTVEDDDYYSYFRAIKSKLDSSLKESSTSLKYPDSITEGSYQDWLFKGEYKAAEGTTESSRTIERVKDDLTFIATTDSKNNVTGLTIYIVDEPAKQVNDEDPTVYGAYQLYETEKEAKKALKKLNGKTGFELLDVFTSLKLTEEIGDDDDQGYAPGYVITTSPTVGIDLTKSDISDENLKNWMFSADRKPYNVEIIEAKDGKGYYLAVFASTEKAWSRSARTGWTETTFADHMKTLVVGYEINEEAMEKIEGVITTTTSTTPATK